MKRRLLLVIPGLLLVLALALFLYVRSFLPPERLRELLEPRIEGALGRDVDIRSLTLSPFPLAVRLDDVRVAASPGFAHPSLLEVGSLRFNLQLLPLLHRRLVVGSLVLDAPRLHLEQHEDGSWNFDGPPAGEPATPVTPPGGAALGLTVRSLRIRDGHVRLRSAAGDIDLEGPLAADLALEVDRALRDVRVRGWIESTALSGRQRSRMLHGVRLRLEPEIRVSVPDSTARIDELRLELQGLSIALQGSAGLEQGRPVVQLQTRAEQIDLAEILGLVPPSVAPGIEKVHASGTGRIDLQVDVPAAGRPLVTGRITLQDGSIRAEAWPEAVRDIRAQVEWTGDVLNISELQARIGDSPLRLHGRILSPLKPESATFDLDIATALDLAVVSGLAPLPEGVGVQGQLGASLRVQGRLSDRQRLSIEGPITLEDVQIRTPRLTQVIGLAAKLEAEGEVVRIVRATLQGGGSRIALEGSLVPALPGGLPRLSLRGRAVRVDFDELLPAREESGPAGQRATTPHAARLIPPLSPAHLDAHLQIDELAVRRANLSATQIDLKSDTEEFTLELRTRVFERDKLVLSGVHGTLRGGASIANGRLQAESGRLDRLQVVDLRSDVRVAGTRVELPNIEGRTYEGRLVGRAEFDLEDPTTPRYVLDVQAEDVQIGDLFAEVWSAGRLVSGKLSGTSTWKSHGADARAMRANLGAGGQGVALDGHIRDLPALTALSNFLSLPELRDLSYRDLGFSFEVASGRVLLPKLQLRGTEADLNVQGSVGLDGTLDLTLNVLLSAELSRRYVRGQVVSALGSLFTNPGGHIVLDFKVGGSFEAPQVRPDLQATASRAGVRSLNRIDLQSFLRELTQQEGTEDTIEENFEDTVEDLGRRLRDAFGGVLGDEKSRDKKSAAPDSTRKP